MASTENEKVILYQGLLHNYYLSNKGGLESIVLGIPYRKTIDDDSTLKEIPSTKLVIPFERIENINLRFMSLIPTESDNGIIDGIRYLRSKINRLSMSTAILKQWMMMSTALLYSMVFVDFEGIYRIIVTVLGFILIGRYLMLSFSMIHKQVELSDLYEKFNVEGYEPIVL